MTTRRLLLGLVVLLLLTVAVVRTRPSAAMDPNTREFPVTGVLTAAPAEGRVMVSHDEIPGYMPAMTMPFAIADGERLPALAPGDRVRFVLRVSEAASAAARFEVVGHDAAVAQALRGPAPSSSRLRKGDTLPALSLVTQSGARFTTADLRGRATALTFIFTRCPVPEFCPLMVKRFQEVQRELAADPSLADARLLAVTLDPAFDTSPVLRAYADAMRADPARWQFVTGPPAEITRLTTAFAVHVERNGVLLDHTLATAVVGPDGRIEALWRGNGWSADEVVAALRTALSATE
jgi:protein SCO1/2